MNDEMRESVRMIGSTFVEFYASILQDTGDEELARREAETLTIKLLELSMPKTMNILWKGK